jgi:ABC-2 type transport system permease protein
MWTEIKHTLRRLRGQIIGWSIGLALYIWMMAAIYPDIKLMNMDALIQYYPEEMLAFFGESFFNIGSPTGYLDLYFFNYMTVILGIFVVGVCAKLLAGQEEEGVLDLIASYPVSRTALFWGRFLGFVAALGIILAVCWLCWALPSAQIGFDKTAYELLLPYFPLAAELLLFGALAILLSMGLPSSRMASWLTGLLLVANYLLVGLANINADLKDIMQYTPLHFYQGGLAIDGVKWEWVAGLTAVALAFAGLGWLLFLRRDIRVGGEGSWRLPLLSRKKKPAPSA